MRAVKTSPGRKIEVITAKIIKADSFLSKLFGLIIRKKLKCREGFLIENCSSIHTFWMRYSIDIVFLDKKNSVLEIYNNFRPFRVTPFIKGSYSVLELRSGEVKKTSLKVGDSVNFEG